MDTEKKDPQDETFYYGHWAWIIGLAVAGGFIFIMFALSDSIS